MKGILTHLGASVTFAAGIYSIFHYLDAASSHKAKKAISDWFKAKYDSSVLASALVEVFDRLYTRPLLGWRALLRSALFTTVITGLVLLVFWSRIKIESELPFVFSLYLSNVISDYISLYLVRLWLGFTGHKPFVALLAGAIVGAAVVIPASATLTFLILYPVYGQPGDPYEHWRWLVKVVTFDRPLNGEILIAALLVHVWLLLFGAGAVSMQVLNGLKYASQAIQRFLDKGGQRPLEAIGIVATVVAFVASMLLLTVLSGAGSDLPD